MKTLLEPKYLCFFHLKKIGKRTILIQKGDEVPSFTPSSEYLKLVIFHDLKQKKSQRNNSIPRGIQTFDLN